MIIIGDDWINIRGQAYQGPEKGASNLQTLISTQLTYFLMNQLFQLL